MANVRILELILENFKNVKQGKVMMPSYRTKNPFGMMGDVLGIYGKNGSGKSAVIEALEVVMQLLRGERFSEEFVQKINHESETATIEIRFAIEEPPEKWIARYRVTVKKVENIFAIIRESISGGSFREEKASPVRLLLGYDEHTPLGEVLPKRRYASLKKQSPENVACLQVAAILAERHKKSFFFGAEGLPVFLAEEAEEYSLVLRALHEYGMGKCVIQNTESMKQNCFTFSGTKINNGAELQAFTVDFNGPFTVTQEQYMIITEAVGKMKPVLKAVLPGITLNLHNSGRCFTENGAEGYQLELFSEGKDTRIPLHQETEGIKRIIRLIKDLLDVYNNRGMCLAVDGIDTGIHEFLLGELMKALCNGAEGQIIFTANNLRAMELMDAKNILCTTTNPDNRFVVLKHISKYENIRSAYLRALTLGGQDEELCQEPDQVEMGRAFRKAGKILEK